MNGRIIREVKKERVAIIGNIKIGRKTEKGHPESLDYFIADGKYKGYFDKEFPDKPKNIEILFLSDDIEDVCFERYEIRQGAKLFAFGNGFDFHVWDEKEVDVKTGEYGTRKLITIEDEPDIKDRLEQQLGVKWQEVLTMRFLIPRIKGIWGVWQLSTKGSASSIPEIVGVFDAIQKMAGTVKNLAFDLSVKKVKNQTPGSKALFPVLQLVSNNSHENLQKVRDFVDNGIEIRGLLTDDKIEQIAYEPQIDEQSVMQNRKVEPVSGKEVLQDKIKAQIAAMHPMVLKYFTDQEMSLEQQYNFCKERNGDESFICNDIQAFNVSEQFNKNMAWDDLPEREDVK